MFFPLVLWISILYCLCLPVNMTKNPDMEKVPLDYFCQSTWSQLLLLCTLVRVAEQRLQKYWAGYLCLFFYRHEHFNTFLSCLISESSWRKTSEIALNKGEPRYSEETLHSDQKQNNQFLPPAYDVTHLVSAAESLSIILISGWLLKSLTLFSETLGPPRSPAVGPAWSWVHQTPTPL